MNNQNHVRFLMNATVEEFSEILIKVFEDRLCKCLQTPVQEKGPKYLTRNETRELLRITLPTLHVWTQKGLLHAHKIADSSRVYYLEEEVINLLQSSKKSAAIYYK